MENDNKLINHHIQILPLGCVTFLENDKFYFGSSGKRKILVV
jgi:hypothetical protein